MFEAGQNWELFGYDMRHLGGHWTAAWRDLLWDYDSPVRKRLDEVVSLRGEDGVACYQAGEKCSGSPASHCEAILLPESLVLSRQLRVPLSAESELAAVMALEVRSSSPFTSDDTGWGWTIVARDESGLQVALAIVSMSAVMAYLGRQYDAHDAQAQEVWVDVNAAMVVVKGFGERAREARYKKRLLHSAGMLVGMAALLLAIAATAATFKGVELKRSEALLAVTTREAAEAAQMKSLLASANETIAAANEVVLMYPNPHVEVARLTRLLGDDASIASFAMNGVELRLRGRAVNAAEVMEQLTAEPSYQQVTAPRATVVLGKTGLEQFYLDIRLAAGEAQ